MVCDVNPAFFMRLLFCFSLILQRTKLAQNIIQKFVNFLEINSGSDPQNKTP